MMPRPKILMVPTEKIGKVKLQFLLSLNPFETSTNKTDADTLASAVAIDSPRPAHDELDTAE